MADSLSSDQVIARIELKLKDRDLRNVWGLLEDCLILLRQQQERPWQPIETAPKDGTAIIGYDRSNNAAESRNYCEFTRWEDDRWIDPETWTIAPTHWMRIPEPPK
jgi:hypothetical protein